MMTIKADSHPLMSRIHKPDPKLPADQQGKRSVMPIEMQDVDPWLAGTVGMPSSYWCQRHSAYLMQPQPSFRSLMAAYN